MKDPVRPITKGSEGVVYERATIGTYAHASVRTRVFKHLLQIY
jgi:hypothetical protein